MMGNHAVEYGKIKVNTKTLDDAVLNLGAIQGVTRGMVSKAILYRALLDNDIVRLREISNYFYKASGIYKRVCDYAATMYRYDWYVVPEVFDESMKSEKILTDFHKVLHYLDNSYIAKTCGDIALSVVRNGAYYGYIVPSPKGVIIQELPINYCRSRFSQGNLPVVEFNMKFFDQAFPDTTYRMQVLNMFPDEFKKGYVAYKSGKLTPTGKSWFDRDTGWWMLEPQNTVKFSFSNGGNGAADIPLFINAIPAILDLDAAQDLDRRKQMQKLLKIIVQKLPLDKNGDLIFDIDEARDIHNNAVEMLRRAVGVDVLTTFAEIDAVVKITKQNRQDVKELMNASLDAQKEFLNANIEENEALQLAKFNVKAKNMGKDKHFVEYFGDEFFGTTLWEKQLKNESLKERE